MVTSQDYCVSRTTSKLWAATKERNLSRSKADFSQRERSLAKRRQAEQELSKGREQEAHLSREVERQQAFIKIGGDLRLSGSVILALFLSSIEPSLQLETLKFT